MAALSSSSTTARDAASSASLRLDRLAGRLPVEVSFSEVLASIRNPGPYGSHVSACVDPTRPAGILFLVADSGKWYNTKKGSKFRKIILVSMKSGDTVDGVITIAQYSGGKRDELFDSLIGRVIMIKQKYKVLEPKPKFDL